MDLDGSGSMMTGGTVPKKSKHGLPSGYVKIAIENDPFI